MDPPPTFSPAKQTWTGFGGTGRVNRGASRPETVRREPQAGGWRWKVEWWREGVDRVSAEVARARDSGNLVSLIVQGQRLQVGTTLYRTPVPLRICRQTRILSANVQT